jgi:hypothetical protein
MTLAKAKAKVKHIYSTGIIYDRHLWSSKYFYNTGHWLQIALKGKTIQILVKLFFNKDIERLDRVEKHASDKSTILL